MLRTSGNNWVHLTCAVFHSAVEFPLAGLEPVSNILDVTTASMSNNCALCHREYGACISCSTCGRSMHVECAARAGHLLGFELFPIKSSQSRRDNVRQVRISNVSGVLHPALHCPKRADSPNKFFKLGDGASTHPSVMWLYIETYRRRPCQSVSSLSSFLTTHPLMDQGSSALDQSPISCNRCCVQFSPAWFKIGKSAHTALCCLRCYHSIRKSDILLYT